MVTTTQQLRIASRGSKLALWQSEYVRSQLRDTYPDLDVSLDIIKTTGDKILDVPLAKIGDRGLFTKELDEALLGDRADLAVHSLKDIPTLLPDGLHIAAIGEREDPRDVLVGPPGESRSLESLPEEARVGTSSLRRRAQLAARRPDLEILDIRGNLDTRLAKLDSGDYDAIVLAAAGLKRLGWEDRISGFLEPPAWVSAVGQGALGIVCRVDDVETNEFLAALDHPPTSAATRAERAFLRRLEGGCQVPIGGYASVTDQSLELTGFIADLSGTRVLRVSRNGDRSDAEHIGREAADHLIEKGAEAILAEVRAQAADLELPGGR